MKPLAFVIEDTEDVAIIFHTAMERAGFEAEIIGNGARAFERLTQIAPDLVVLDLHLPGASGEQIFRYIRSDPRFENTKVIIATADAGWAEKLSGASTTSTITMLKPISFTQLRQIAERLRPHVE